MFNRKKKWTMMNPIWTRMKKCNPSSEQNEELMHMWLLVHSSQCVVIEMMNVVVSIRTQNKKEGKTHKKKLQEGHY